MDQLSQLIYPLLKKHFRKHFKKGLQGGQEIREPLLMSRIKGGRHFIFLEADIHIRLRISIYGGGHFIKSAS